MTDEKPNSKLISAMNYVIAKLESRAERLANQSNNHELISKITFILVLGMSYELLGERIVTLVTLLL